MIVKIAEKWKDLICVQKKLHLHPSASSYFEVIFLFLDIDFWNEETKQV